MTVMTPAMPAAFAPSGAQSHALRSSERRTPSTGGLEDGCVLEGAGRRGGHLLLIWQHVWHARLNCRHLLTAAQLVAERGGVAAAAGTPAFVAGYDWAIEQLKAAGFTGLAAEVGTASARALPAAACCHAALLPAAPAVARPGSVGVTCG